MASTNPMPEVNSVIREDLERIASSALPWERLRDKTVLITGGGGFLASYLVKTLIVANRIMALNLRVVCVVRNLCSAEQRLAGFLGASDISVLVHDISRPLLSDAPRADFIIHAASQASPKYYGVDPVGTLLANSVGTAYLLDHAVHSGSEAFLFFSSGEVYGDPVDPARLVAEKDYGYLDPMNVRSCYAESKRIGETMCVAWAKQRGLNTKVVRPFHTYGPGMALDDGRVFADFVADVVAGRNIVLKSDGMAKRAFCYVGDATAGFLTVLLSGGKAEAYNVGNSDAEISVLDLATLVAGLFPDRGIGTRVEPPIPSNAYLKSPIQRSCPDISKIRGLGWCPVVGVEEGFRRTLRSFFPQP